MVRENLCWTARAAMSSVLVASLAASQVPIPTQVPSIPDWLYPRSELVHRVGRMEQVAGIEQFSLIEGAAQGVRVARVSTGTGLVFDVVLDRGMDLGQATHRGRSLCWLSPVGVVGPAFHDPQAMGWQYGFGGGLLVTCGLASAGAPALDDGEFLGLHGRASFIPADNVIVRRAWQGDRYVLTVEGDVREAAVTLRNLLLHRRISTELGSDWISIEDTYTNEGHKPTPLSLIYHFNLGYPLIDEGTTIELPSLEVSQVGSATGEAIPTHKVVGRPRPDDPGATFLHNAATDAEGWTLMGAVNHRLDQGEGLALAIRYRKEHLPFLGQWNMQQPGTYVVGLEPANTYGLGRNVDRARGVLRQLLTGESITIPFEIRVILGQAGIDQFRLEVARLRQSGSPRPGDGG